MDAAAQARVTRSSEKPGYRAEIDSLRALAVASVLLSHWLPGFADLLNWGLVGVYVFFVISGYVITRGLLGEANGRTGAINLRRFYMRRALRIWPIYYLTIAIAYFVWPGFEPGTVGWHLAFLSNVLFGLQAQYGFPVHFWSLAVEMQFYLVWPLLVRRYPERLPWICVAAIVVAPVSRGALAAALYNLPAAYFALSSNVDCLAAGALLAWLERGMAAKTHARWLIHGAAAASAMLLAFIIVMNALGQKIWAIAFAGTATAGFAVWIIARLASPSPMTSVLLHPFPRFIGQVSYGIYMYHLMMGGALQLTPMGQWSPPWFCAGAVTLTVAAATVSWYVIERPILKLQRHPWVLRLTGAA